MMDAVVQEGLKLNSQRYNLALVENIRWECAGNRQDIIPEVLIDLGLMLLSCTETGAVDPNQLLCCHVTMREAALDMGLEAVMEPAARALDGGR